MLKNSEWMKLDMRLIRRLNKPTLNTKAYRMTFRHRRYDGHQWVRDHRIAAFVVVALLAGSLVYLLAAPEDFESRLRTVTAITTGIGASGILLNLMFTSETLAHARKSQLDDRFFKAATLLDSGNTDGKIGALYALGRIAHESNDHATQVIDLVCAFIRRTSASLKPTYHRAISPATGAIPAPDEIAVAMQVLIDRPSPALERQLDLRGAYLCCIELHDGDFERANFTDASLVGLRASACSFRGALFHKADLRYGLIGDSDLRDSKLTAAKLQFASLRFDKFFRPSQNPVRVFFSEETDDEAWRDALAARYGDLSQFDMRINYLENSDWRRVELEDTYVGHTDLRGIKGLLKSQLGSLRTPNDALLPHGNELTVEVVSRKKAD